MNKRILVIVAMTAALTASTAFADRAHILVMGTGDGGTMLGALGNMGSFFIDDPYNIFYNPSYVNDYKNWGTIEKSNGAFSVYPGPTSPYSGVTPGAEGGFVASISNFNVGAYFDRPSQTGVFGANAPTRPIDLFIGSDMGIKWGLGFTWASNTFANTGNNTTNSDYAIHAGVQIMDLEPFFMYEKGTDNTGQTGTAANSTTTLMAGAKYHWGEWTPYAAWLSSKDSVAGASSNSVAANWGIGLGRSTKIAEGARMAYALSYWRQASIDRNMVPIDFSVEGDAMSWLTLRGGVSYHVYDQTGGISNGDMTTGRIGAGIHVGKADFDFAVGKAVAFSGFNEQPVAGAGTGGTTLQGSDVDSQYFDIGPGFFTAASLSYHW